MFSILDVFFSMICLLVLFMLMHLSAAGSMFCSKFMFPCGHLNWVVS